MNLSEKSWHAKLYYLTFGENKYLPNNLCPYFWKLVLCCILFIPLSLWFILLFVVYFALNVGDSGDRNVKEDGYLSEQFIFATMINIAAFLIFSMVYMWFIPFTDKVHFFQVFGIIGYLILLVIAFMIVRSYWLSRRQHKRPTEYKEPKPNILIEFVKAKYNRYCPKIDWNKK